MGKRPAADPSGTVPMPAGEHSATTRIEVADAHLRAAMARRGLEVGAVVQQLEHSLIEWQGRAKTAEARVVELEEQLAELRAGCER